MGKGIGSGRGRPKAPINHGTYYAYNKRKCRCKDCHAALFERNDKYKYPPLKNKLKSLPEHPLRKIKGE